MAMRATLEYFSIRMHGLGNNKLSGITSVSHLVCHCPQWTFNVCKLIYRHNIYKRICYKKIFHTVSVSLWFQMIASNSW
jgi:hypothetical protein